MRQYIILAFLSLSTSILFGQLSRKTSTKFEYTDIDSLVQAEIKHLNKEKVKFIVAQSVIYYGATITYSDTTLMPCNKNPFEILFLFSKRNVFFLKMLNNHGHFKTQKVLGQRLNDFINSHYNEIEKENLNPKNSSKEQIQISEKYFIAGKNKILEFEFPIEYYNNETNLKTFKYQLINLFSEIKKELFKNK